MPLSKFGEISGIISSNIFQPHSSFSLGILMKWMLDFLLLFYGFLRISSFYLAYFFVFCSNWVISTHLSSSLQILSSTLLSSTLRIFKCGLLHFSVLQFPLGSFFYFLARTFQFLICFKSASNYLLEHFFMTAVLKFLSENSNIWIISVDYFSSCDFSGSWYN